jgi:hypothetical protein
MPSFVKVPCKWNSSKFISGFLVNLTEDHAFVLQNAVWAVTIKVIPIETWRKDWSIVTIDDAKRAAILEGLKNYAVYAGITPEAVDHLSSLIPMSTAVKQVALDKGNTTLKRFRTQAEAEAAAAGERPLAGAALQSVARKEIEKAEGPTTLAERRRTSDKAKEVRALVDQVSKDLTDAEVKGKNPVKALKAKGPLPKPKKEPRPKKVFDVANLKGEDGKWKSVSAAFKGLILEGKLSDDKIFAAVKKQFGIDDSKRGYVQWNRNWLKKEGLLNQ